MNYLLHHGILLAQRNRFESLSSGFRGRRARIETEDIVTGLLILLGAAAAIGLLSYVVRRQEHRRGYTGPRRLFLSLCKAHRLRWRQRWLLYRVARAQRLRDPGRLFLEPDRFQPANLNPSLRKHAAELRQLRDRLFAEPEEKREQGKPIDRPPERPQTPPPAAPIPPTTASPTLDLPAWTTASDKGIGTQ